MTKYFTAVGRFIHPSDSSGNTYPSVFVGSKECMLDSQELIVWSILNWRILKLDEIGKHYEKEARVFGYANDRSWKSCLERLVVRGLVVTGNGETDYDALYNLLSPLYILPLTGNVLARFLTYLKIRCSNPTQKDAGKTLIRKDSKSKKEKHLMRLIQQATITVGELVRCVDKGIRSLDGDQGVLDAIYDDAELTCDNIGSTVKYALCCQDVTLSVANLYLRQQLIFDRI